MRRTGCLTARWLGGLVVLATVFFAALARAAAPTPSPSSSPPTWGETVLLQGLADHFSVPAEELQTLRSQGFGVGELAVLYSLATSAGSDTAAGLNEVLQLRASGMGWGEIARQLGIDGADLGRRVAEALQGAAQSAGKLIPAGPGAGARRAAVERELLKATDAALAALPEPARAPVARLADNWRAPEAGGGAPSSTAAAPGPGGGPSGKGKPDAGAHSGKGSGGGGQGKGKG